MSAMANAFLTTEMVKAVDYASAALAALSFLLEVFILSASAYIYKTPQAKHHLDRLSFRLLLIAVLMGSGYDLGWIIFYSNMVVSRVPHLCQTGVYFMLGELHTINFICTCIAVNLMLTVCFEINPASCRLERWYIGVSMLGMIIPIAPAALGWFGWDDQTQICWMKPTIDHSRAVVQLISLHLWQLLCCLIATVSTAFALFSLFRQNKRTQEILKNNPLRVDEPPGEPWWRPSAQTDLHRLQENFWGIAVRVSLYPLALIVTNGIIAIGSIFISHHGGVTNRSTFALYVIYSLLYGGRGIIIACLCIFVDPCLRRGLTAAWQIRHPKLLKDHQIIPLSSASQGDLLRLKSNKLDEEPESPLNPPPLAFVLVPRRSEVLDLTKAMRDTGPVARFEDQIVDTPPGGRSEEQQYFTRSFAGVHDGDLPEGLTDHVDIDLTRVVSMG